MTRIYQFDVGLDETLRRHDGRTLGRVIGSEKIREWYDGWQPLPWFEEHRVGPEVGTDELVSVILHDIGGRRPHPPTGIA